MLPACLPVQEMWDHIFDHLQPSKSNQKDLKACSLVCRSFVASAQSHIFREIILEAHHVDDTACDRLANLLTTSPHLIRYTHILDLTKCDKRVLVSINRIPWSHLKTLSLGHVVYPEVPPAIRELHKLVRLPSLRHLVVRGRAWKTEHLRSIVRFSTPMLERIDLVHCRLEPISSRPLPQTFQKLRIRHLSLYDSESAGELLADLACPVDLSGLTHLYSRVEPLSPALAAVLIRSCSTIHTLHYIAYADRKPLDLGLFTALRCLKLGELFTLEPYADIHPCAAALARLRPDNTVAAISLTVFGPGYREYWTNVAALARDLRDLDGALVESRMPALQRVEVSVDSSEAREWIGLGSRKMVKLIRAEMPLLHARGILTIVKLETVDVADQVVD
ncbi:hypothetical protein B0H13DRAFT_2581539 [Mycena leptocephala]|nr:hypothetical protein B0H13DRAFT_2581539 [Mycena leptocephala]